MFWAGDTFAPKLKIKAKNGTEMSVQQYLQGAFLNMNDVVAKKLGNLEGVLGFEVSLLADSSRSVPDTVPRL